MARPDIHDGGDAGRGLAIFCGGLRFFGVRWGIRAVPAGLAMAGFGGRVVYWPWHGRHVGWVSNVGALWNRKLHDRQGLAIASAVADQRARHPDAPVYLLGCSGGGWQVVRALEVMGPGVQADAGALLSAAVATDYDLSAALRGLRGPLVNSSSVLDFLLLGIGTWLFGTGDGANMPSAGMLGFSGRWPGVTELRFGAGMIRCGRWGGHHSATAARFLAGHVWPAMHGVGASGAGLGEAGN